jgi:hypothetical protein
MVWRRLRAFLTAIPWPLRKATLAIADISQELSHLLPLAIRGASLYMTTIVAWIDEFSLDFLSSTLMLAKNACRYRNTLSLSISFRTCFEILRIALGGISERELDLRVFSQEIQSPLFTLSNTDIGESRAKLRLAQVPSTSNYSVAPDSISIRDLRSAKGLMVMIMRICHE